jgi:plasmid stabilization system protein ParE
MTPRFIVRPEAEADLTSAFRWYEAKSWGLGTEFLRAVDVCFAKVRRTPQAYQEIKLGVRRARLRRFPYSVYYIIDDRGIAVVACLHWRRNPKEWMRRL